MVLEFKSTISVDADKLLESGIKAALQRATGDSTIPSCISWPVPMETYASHKLTFREGDPRDLRLWVFTVKHTQIIEPSNLYASGQNWGP